jgi:hypothetical protein
VHGALAQHPLTPKLDYFLLADADGIRLARGELCVAVQLLLRVNPGFRGRTTMPPLIAIVVYSCLASAPLDDFNPHMLGAVQAYVTRHPGICSAEPPLILERDITLEECQSQGFLHFMPNWIAAHQDRVYLGAPCFVHRPEPLELYPLPQNASAGP